MREYDLIRLPGTNLQRPDVTDCCDVLGGYVWYKAKQ